jgi:RimJ/RimL family protein N-acetyltransferase
LRRYRPEDAETLRRWHADPRYMEHLGGATDDPAATDAALERWERHWTERGFGSLAAEDRGTGALVGRGGPQFHRAWQSDPEVGWAVDPEWWGRGIATEMGTACVGWALGDLGFRRVVSITTEANVVSRRVMAKLGFAFLTTVREPVLDIELWVHARDRVAR